MSSVCGQNKFAVVVFGKETSVIPLLWLNSDRSQCQWPDVIGSALTKLLINPSSVPKDTWKFHSTRVLGTYRTLKSAREAEENALYTSVIESDQETDVTDNRTRTRRRQVRRVDVHESDIEDSLEDSGANQVSLNLPESGLFKEPTIESVPASPNEYLSETASVVPIENCFQGSEVLLLDPNSAGLNNHQLIQTIIQESPPVTPNLFSVQTHYQNESQNKFQEIVLRKLAAIQVSQERLLYIVGQNQVVDVEDFDDLPIPCSTKQDLENLEQKMANIEDRHKLERYLASIGGADLKKVVKGILSKLITDEFGILVSFSGKGLAELAFTQFVQVHRSVIRSTRKHKAFNAATEGSINGIIQDWLRQSKDRFSGRVHKKKQENSITPRMNVE